MNCFCNCMAFRTNETFELSQRIQELDTGFLITVTLLCWQGNLPDDVAGFPSEESFYLSVVLHDRHVKIAVADRFCRRFLLRESKLVSKILQPYSSIDSPSPRIQYDLYYSKSLIAHVSLFRSLCFHLPPSLFYVTNEIFYPSHLINYISSTTAVSTER